MDKIFPVYSTFEFGDVTLIYCKEKEQLASLIVPTAMATQIADHRKVLKDTLPCYSIARVYNYDFPAYEFEPLTQLKIAGDMVADQHNPGDSMHNNGTAKKFKFVSQEKQGDTIVTRFEDERKIAFIQNLRYLPCGAFVINSEVVNNGTKPVNLEYLTSFALSMLSPFRPDAGPDCYKVHRFHSNWSAECRPESMTAELLGLEASWQGAGARTLRFGQRSTMPCKNFYPFVALEDTVSHVTWAAEISAPGPWQLELNRQNDFFSLSGGLPDREFNGWCKTLAPGDRFSGPEAIVTVVQGGRDEAAWRLAGYQQSGKAVEKPEAQDIPVIFNEWCTTWGTPSAEKLRPVVKALSGLPVDYMVLDDGWFVKEGDAPYIGDWTINQKQYPEKLSGFTAELERQGLKPGVWFEFENCGASRKIAKEHSEYFLHLDGSIINSGGRIFFDFTRPEVWEYLDQKMIAMLKENRFRYMKVDYNAAVPFGADASDDAVPAEKLRQHVEAVLRYFDHLREKLPDLFIEICASGGHRITPYWVRYADVISATDAHEGVEIPLISAHEALLIPARALTIWAAVRGSDDENRLAYSLAAGCIGHLTLSGDPERLSPERKKQLADGIGFFRKCVPVLRDGVPALPHTLDTAWNSPHGYQLFKRSSSAGTMFVLHTFEEAPQEIVFDVPGKLAASFVPSTLSLKIENGKVCIVNAPDFTGCALLFE